MSPHARMRGFTLLEVLLATVLLAAGLALAFATLRSATQMTARGEAVAQRNERIRAVHGFLRARIGAAQAIAFETEADTGRALRFLGDETRVRFVADLPDYLGRGGPHLHDVAFGDDGRLTVDFAMVQAGRSFGTDPRPPEPLGEGLREVRFAYRGLDDEGKLGDWQPKWERAEILPLQVAVEFETADGAQWPRLVVQLAGGGNGNSGILTQ